MWAASRRLSRKRREKMLALDARRGNSVNRPRRAGPRARRRRGARRVHHRHGHGAADGLVHRTTTLAAAGAGAAGAPAAGLAVSAPADAVLWAVVPGGAGSVCGGRGEGVAVTSVAAPDSAGGGKYIPPPPPCVGASDPIPSYGFIIAGAAAVAGGPLNRGWSVGGAGGGWDDAARPPRWRQAAAHPHVVRLLGLGRRLEAEDQEDDLELALLRNLGPRVVHACARRAARERRD